MSRLHLFLKTLRKFSSSSDSLASSSSSYFATTPIYYATNAPHIGHLHSSILADAAVRCARLLLKTKNGEGNNTILSTGTDEHGQKVAAAATSTSTLFQKGALSPLNQELKSVVNPGMMRKEALSFCDNVSDKYRTMNDSFSIEARQFVRTTSWRHACVVGWLWRRLEKSGAIYVGEHEGWYCQSDEAFLTDTQVVMRREYLILQKNRQQSEAKSGEGGSTENASASPAEKIFASEKERELWLEEKVSSESGHPVERLKETNFMFRLTSFTEFLQELHSTPVQSSVGSRASCSFVEPKVRADEMLALINNSEGITTTTISDGGMKGINQGLRDFSVSRRRDRVPWGLPVPPLPVLSESTISSSSSSPSLSTSRGDLANEPHNVYVWLDALASYLTASAADAEWAKAVDAKESIAARGGDPSNSSFSSPSISITEQEALMQSLPLDADWRTLFPAWPVDLHVLGKDILKFHSLYWPAFLKGAGLPPPKRIVAHGHWTVSGSKMSKSIGNVVAPQSLLLENGGGFKSDAVRYFLLREGRLHLDGDFNPQLLQQRCSKECADTFGNLATRILNKLFMPFGVATLYPGIKLGLPSELLKSLHSDTEEGRAKGIVAYDSAVFSQEISLTNQQIELLSQGVGLKESLEEGYLSAEPGPALEKLIGFLQLANKTYSDSAPWKVKPEKEDLERWSREEDPTKVMILSDRNLRLAGTLYTILEALRLSAILLQPTMPVCAPQLLNALGVDSNSNSTAKEEAHLDLTSWESARPGVSLPQNFNPVTVLKSKNAASLVLFPKPPREEEDTPIKATESEAKSLKAKKEEAKKRKAATALA